MTPEQPDERPSLDDAARLAEESRRRAEADMIQARERARRSHGLARVLARLREENGFGPMFDGLGGRGG